MSHLQEDADAVAIVGMSCRFVPALNSPSALWDVLLAGRFAVGSMPPTRSRACAETSPEATPVLRGTTLHGSHSEDIEGFDARHFGIAPKEAAYLDPQQRIMLKLTWEALVDAGIPPTSPRGSDTGVYVAVNLADYGRRLLEDMTLAGLCAVNGATDYGIAKRVSHLLDTRGPSVTVNTACTASLTVVHVACRALRDGETSVAIVGGINPISTPMLNVPLQGVGALAPDGGRDAYDGSTDGYGRGEGAGVLVLKRFSDAVGHGDPVLAVVRASGVFQDGRSEGMMAPSADTQARMLRTVYRRAGIAPETVGYLEAYGTGTPTGDAAELEALSAVVGVDRKSPCVVGSIEPKIGHVEGGSGIAGIIKVVLALCNGVILPTVYDSATSVTDWATNGLQLIDRALPWARSGEPRRAGVSNYGVGGTIAHLVVEEAPVSITVGRDVLAATPYPQSHRRAIDHRPVRAILPVSAATVAGVRALAQETAQWLARQQPPFADVEHTLRLRRSHLAERVAVLAADAAQAGRALSAAASGVESLDVVAGRSVSGAGKGLVWVFSGHGSQWEGMGQELLDVNAAFTEAIDALSPVYAREIGWTPREKLTDGGPWTTSEVQALTFALQAALSATWRAHDLEPAAVIGHSVGEIAAAYAAGVLERDAAAQFVCRRARALQSVAGTGAMLMADLSFSEARCRLEGVDDVTAAIEASPTVTVISGDAAGVGEVAAVWRAEGIPVRPVDTDLAFHSQMVEGALPEVIMAALHLKPRNADVPLYSTALEDPRSGVPRNASYWARNLRAPVRFAGAVTAALEDGYRLFLEVSTHPVVTHSIKETAESLGLEIAAKSTVRRGAGAPDDVLKALAGLFCAGATPNWGKTPGGALLALPE